ncbi:MAG: hypothetical protein WBF03_04235 [Xanthobacteraceae bacterium]
MTDIVSFIRPGAGFDPETIDMLSRAFEDAWRRIEASNYPLARPGYATATREVIAKHIIDLAQSGEREPTKLSDSAIEFLNTNYKN